MLWKRLRWSTLPQPQLSRTYCRPQRAFLNERSYVAAGIPCMRVYLNELIRKISGPGLWGRDPVLMMRDGRFGRELGRSACARSD